MMKLVRIGVIACGAAKLDHSAPAQDLYVGNLFQAARAYVEETCDEWAILSALHGIVRPDRVLEPYEATWARMPADARRARKLAHATSLVNYLALREGGSWDYRLRRPLGRGVQLVVLAGVDYREVIDRAMASCSGTWEADVVVPMAGLGLGEQLTWLKANTPSRTQAGRLTLAEVDRRERRHEHKARRADRLKRAEAEGDAYWEALPGSTSMEKVRAALRLAGFTPPADGVQLTLELPEQVSA